MKITISLIVKVNLVPRAFLLKVGFPAPPTFKGKALETRLSESEE